MLTLGFALLGNINRSDVPADSLVTIGRDVYQRSFTLFG
jgi:hypothetical protein